MKTLEVARSALGHCPPVGNPEEAGLLVCHSFATVQGPGSANDLIANFVVEHANGRPIVADRALVNAIPNGDEIVACPVEGPVTDNLGKGVGTWGVLLEAIEFMEREGLEDEKVLMIAHKRHVGRVVMQGYKAGMRRGSIIIPSGLPDKFEPESEQLGTRSPSWWFAHEVVGSQFLRLKGQL